MAGERETKAARRRSARERLAAEREAARKRARQRKIATVAVGGVAGVAVLGLIGWAVLAGTSGKSHAKSGPPGLPTPVMQNAAATMPPWPVPADTIVGARAAGLMVNNMEGTVTHFHSHLDIIVNGQPVTVPANLGISVQEQAISELHTHDTRGVLHVESASSTQRFILGQAFTEWRVKLTATQLGGLVVDAKHTLTAYVDGKKFTGDPATIELKPHREIALVYGSPDQKVTIPSSFAFQQGE